MAAQSGSSTFGNSLYPYGNQWISVTTGTDTNYYGQHLVAQDMPPKAPKAETPMEWLDRSVNEVRRCWK